jgi:hypothetical protein
MTSVSGSGSASRARRSGSLSISTKCKAKLLYAFFCPKYYNFDPYDADEKVKTMYAGTTAYVSPKVFLIFEHV